MVGTVSLWRCFNTVADKNTTCTIHNIRTSRWTELSLLLQSCFIFNLPLMKLSHNEMISLTEDIRESDTGCNVVAFNKPDHFQ